MSGRNLKGVCVPGIAAFLLGRLATARRDNPTTFNQFDWDPRVKVKLTQ